MHARLDARVRADGDFRIDQHCLRHLNRHAPIQYGSALATSKHRIHSGQIGARVASKDFVRVGGEDGLHVLAFLSQHGDRVRQVELFVHVLRFQRSKTRPQFFESEAVDAGIDFADRALIVGERRILNNGGHGTAVAPENAPVARGILNFSGKNGCSRVGLLVRACERRKSLRANQRRIARQQDSELRARRDRAPRHEHCVSRAALRLLQRRLHAERRDRAGHVVGLMTHDRDNLTRLERLARAHDVLDQRAPARAVQHFRPSGFQPRALARSQDHNHEVGSRHTHIVSGSCPFDNERRCRTVRMGHLCGAFRRDANIDFFDKRSNVRGNIFPQRGMP